MSTKEEFEKLQELLSSCLASVRCGCDISTVDNLSLDIIQRKSLELSYELAKLGK